MMGEEAIRDLAHCHKLGVDKRITTGNPQVGFATFELFGVARNVKAAHEEAASQVPMGFISLRHSEISGELYVAFESVWFDSRQ